MGIPGENDFGVVGNYCEDGSVPTQENMFFPPVKEVVQLTNCVLYPPNPNAPRPPTRERPVGCKTVFVSGLPEKISEHIIKEVFERCGNVETVRMPMKNFCHIRFTDEVYVDNAIYFSGYTLKIENKDEAPFTGRLRVDFAQARDDQYDYECKQRDVQCQARHQEQDYVQDQPPTPAVVHYTDHESSLICEKLENEETFAQAASIIINWLEKGECTKENARSFFPMIQSTHNYVRKLQIRFEFLVQLRAFMRRITEDNPDSDNDSVYENNSHVIIPSNVNVEKEARLIGLISTFLHVHPFGASIDYICSYLHQIDPTIRSREVENLLKRYPMIYREDSSGIGASLGKKWYFTGFRRSQ